MDKVLPAKRSEIMRSVHSKDTRPELAVRRLAFVLGFRFRVNVKNLPGKPDIAIKSRRKAVFVHGCFWHRHKNCKHATMPATNVAYWKAKFSRNVLRDQEVLASYAALGWIPLVIWECEIRNTELLARRLSAYLGQRQRI